MNGIVDTVTSFYLNLPTGVKVFWCILAAAALISLIRAVFGREGGGIAAGIILGLAVSIFLPDSKLFTFLGDLPPYFLIPLGIVGVIAILFAVGGMLMLSTEWYPDKRLRLPAILLRIPAIAVISALAVLVITSIGNAGYVFFNLLPFTVPSPSAVRPNKSRRRIYLPWVSCRIR
ncbi:MAG: hypothetical protein IJ930_09810 [Lachnospiraceae bacterium]|nr:hypothetical protein [Lachnospiraceae bacterium]